MKTIKTEEAKDIPTVFKMIGDRFNSFMLTSYRSIHENNLPKGIKNPRSKGVKQNMITGNWFGPLSSILSRELLPPLPSYFASLLNTFSRANTIKTNATRKNASLIAALISYIPNQDLKIPIVNVDTPKYSTAA